ncbi:MAG: DnaA N-terminal domain-containing protein [Rickettsiales endosymbiont of Dermacentor nuttalli]
MQLFYPLARSSENIGIHKYLDTTKNQSYIPITGCLLSHILSCSRLSSLEKMYYILADSISYINSSKGRNRSISLPAKSWSSRLSCSKAEVFVLQKSLEDKGYFLIHRDKNEKGQNNRNIITTTIPDKVFNDLKYEPDRFALCDINDEAVHQNNSKSLDLIDKTFIPTIEGKRQHLEKTKMFIRVSYQFLKQLNSNCSISAISKIILLYLFTKIYKSSANKYNYDDSDSALTYKSYSIVTSYQELQKELKLHRNSLAKALKDLEDHNFISKQRFFIKDTEDHNSRADKSLWKISVLNVSLITKHHNQHEQNNQAEQNNQEEHIGQQQAVINNHNQESVISDQNEEEYNNNKTLKSSKEWECTKYDPACTDSDQLYNKDFVLKNSIIKNIDYIDAKKEFLGNEQSSFPSESYNNSFESSIKAKPSYFNTTSESAARIIEDIPEYKELRHFYPLSEQDVDTLNFRAGREFSNNFVNQLLLKLYIKCPEKRFKNKFTFLSYMAKILKNEKHQGPLVNHTTFRFSCNINSEEQNLLEYEKYLSQIENSLDTSKEMQVRKKISGRFSTNMAYEILTQVEFKTNHDNSFITALIPNRLDLSERQIATLSEQIEAVYGINGYYVTVIGDEGSSEGGRGKGERKEAIEKQYSKIKEPDIISNSQDIGILDIGKGLDIIEENTAWHQIRKGLIEELGAVIDGVWFSKAETKECRETGTLTLTMPTRFMADWIRNNYSHVIRRLSEGCGVKRVEYGYNVILQRKQALCLSMLAIQR